MHERATTTPLSEYESPDKCESDKDSDVRAVHLSINIYNNRKTEEGESPKLFEGHLKLLIILFTFLYISIYLRLCNQKKIL